MDKKQPDHTPGDLLTELSRLTGTKVKQQGNSITVGDLDSLPKEIRDSIEQDIKETTHKEQE